MAKKNKTSTYLLLILVIAIWGIIVYKIVEARQGDVGSSEYLLSKKNTQIPANPKFVLNYRDPFLDRTEHPTSKVVPKKTIQPPKIPAIQRQPTISYSALLANVRSSLTFNGIIANRTRKGLIGVIQKNGEILHVTVLSSIDSLKVIGITKDTLLLKGKYTYPVLKQF